MSGFVDIRLLARTAAELAPAGPALSPDAIAEVVAQLRTAAETSVDLVLDVMRLEQGRADAARARAAADQVLVVDRSTWAKATAQSMDAMLDPVVSPRVREALAGSRVASSLELGGVLAVLSTRVLGQFDPFGGDAGEPARASAGAAAAHGGGPEAGRLLLVAPTVAQTEVSLRVPPRDFRLWVALHESTHRMQFAAAPWLRGHLQQRAADLLDAEAAEAGSGGLLRILRRLPSVVRGEAELMDLLTGPAQRAALDEVVSVMSLLEGHADVVMDAVGTAVLPSLPTIRRRFEARRDAGIGLAGVLGRLVGADSKLRQYREGATFVRGVVRRVGHAGLAAAFDSPQNLPTGAELASPRLWIRRVHGE
jgi:coenzyme F420 biosynthesis associated uncharacterized protein